MPRSFTVLLVEDDDPLRRCLTELLDAHGMRVQAVADGRSAIDLARSTRPDFSLLDFHLPGMTGLEVLRSLQREFERPIPSIMMSGNANSEETAEALRAGVFQFLPKPLDLANLRVALDQLILHHFPTR